MGYKQVKQDLLRYLGKNAAGSLINLLIKTLRVERINYAPFEETAGKEQCVVAFWHGKMFLGWYLQKNKNFSALVSLSKDGDVLSSLLTGWGFKVARGSSHIGGKEALQIMMDQAKQGTSIAITPDGSKGPARKMKAGAVVLAKKCGIKLFAAGIGYKRKISLRSWDSFEIPLPFTRAVAIYSDPVVIDRELTYDETSGKIVEFEKLLNELTEKAEAVC